MPIKEKITVLKDKILVADMEFGQQITESGIFVPGADGRTQGIIPRWGKVWAVGPEQTEISVGDWVLIEHGRWTRTVEVEENENIIEVRMVDNDAIILVSDEKPNDILRVAF